MGKGILAAFLSGAVVALIVGAWLVAGLHGELVARGFSSGLSTGLGLAIGFFALNWAVGAWDRLKG